MVISGENIKQFTMKKNLSFIVAGLMLLFASCTPSMYYHQVYEVSSTNAGNDQGLVYSDANCTMTYNFWKEEGNAGFWFENKTDRDLFVDLSKSFFIKNGVAYDYYRNRVTGFSEKKEVSYSVGYDVYLHGLPLSEDIKSMNTGTATQTTYYVEPREICIPAQTRKFVTCDYPIYIDVFRDCNLPLYPTMERKWNNDTKTYMYKPPVVSYFELQNSPIVFKNIITYRTEDSSVVVKTEREFFVSQVANYEEREAITDRGTETMCDDLVVKYGNYMRFYAPNRFYNRYRYSVQTYNGH